MNSPRITAHRLALSVIAAALMANGCATGPRPSLLDVPAVSDPAIGAVINLLEMADSTEFSANYVITVNYGGRIVASNVTQIGTRRSVTIGDVRFVSDDLGQRTCTLVTGVCVPGLDDTRVSDVQVTHQFWSRAMVNRLRTDAERNIATPRGYQAEYAGNEAVCVVVPVTGGDKSYCALATGPLASYAGPDISIELIEWSSTADESNFTAGDA